MTIPVGLPLLAVFAASALGALMGCITGLVPGLHSNNVATVVGTNPGFIVAVATIGIVATDGQGWELAGAAAIVACAVAHTVANIVPAIFLAVPEGEVALSVLPGHRLARMGRGREALRISVISSLASLLIAIALVVPVRAIMGPGGGLYDRLMPWLAPALLLVSALMVLREVRKKGPKDRSTGPRWMAPVYALAIFVAAGALGHVALFRGEAVGPLFIGLFGLPTLLLSIVDTPALHRVVTDGGNANEARGVHWTSVIRGSLAGTMVGWFPGVSPAQATILANPGQKRAGSGTCRGDDEEGAKRFIASVSAINTSNAIFNLVALATLLRVRSGATAAVGELMAWSEPPWTDGPVPALPAALLLAAAAIGGLVAVPVTLHAGRGVERLLPLLSDRRGLYVLVVVLAAVCVGWGGLEAGLILVATTALGLLPPVLGLMRVHLMGAVTLPLALSILAGSA